MAKISDEQIAGYAKAAGLTGTNLAIAVAVALAESGGDTTAYNGVGADNSYGLWQINMIGDLGPARRAQFGITSNDQLFDPAINARAMAMISRNGANWTPWTTYTSGRYLAYLTRGRTAAGNPSTPGTSVIPVSSTSGLESLKSVLDRMGDSKFWIRLAMFMVGSWLILVAMLKMTGATQLAGLIPVGRVAKIAGTVLKK